MPAAAGPARGGAAGRHAPARLLVAVGEAEPAGPRSRLAGLEAAAVAAAILELPIALDELAVLPCAGVLRSSRERGERLVACSHKDRNQYTDTQHDPSCE